MPFPFELVSPDKVLFSGPAQAVVIPGYEGDFQVLADHAPTMSAVRPGVVAITDMMYTPTGKQALMDTMGDFKNPFNVIVGSMLTLKAGSMVPTGKLDASVTIKAHAAP